MTPLVQHRPARQRAGFVVRSRCSSSTRINDLEFDGGAGMLPRAVRMARRIAALKAKRISASHSHHLRERQFRAVAIRLSPHGRALPRDDVRGRPVVEQLVPDETDYFVLKPKHSGFYNTTLDLLLDYLQTKTVIITGMATDVCVLFTAADAYMRDLGVIVPSDCVTALTPRAHRTALGADADRVLKAEVASSLNRPRALARLERAQLASKQSPR